MKEVPVSPNQQVEEQSIWEDITVKSTNRGKQISPTTSKKSWTDEVEKTKDVAEKKSSIWDNFDIDKVINAGFKLEYVAPSR